MGRSHVRRCHSCRRRKFKCDALSPACERCLDQGEVCPGYERKLEIVFVNQEPKQKGGVIKSSKVPVPRVVDRTKGSDPQRQLATNIHTQRSHNSIGETQILNVVLNHSLAIPQHKTGVLSVLAERPGDETCSSWILKACALASTSKYSEMLSNSLLAISLALVSDNIHHDDVSKAAVKHYSSALTGLRAGLKSGIIALNQRQEDVNLVTCLACGMFEMIANRSFDTLLHHLNGVGAILISRGVGNLRSYTSQRTFFEYRSIYLPINLGTRVSNFLSLPEWINPPWKDEEPHSRTALQTVLDISFRVPPLMEGFERIRGFPTTDFPIGDASIRFIDGILQHALDIQADLERWDRRLRAERDSPDVYIPRNARAFATSDMNDLQNVFPDSYNFLNWDVASGLIYREMIQIYLNTFLQEIIAYILQHRIFLPKFSFFNARDLREASLTSADRLCRSIEYFLEDHKGLIGRMVILAPFECAKNFYGQILRDGTGDIVIDAELDRKLRFCRKVTERIMDAGLPIWAQNAT